MMGSLSQNQFFVKPLVEAVHTRVEVRDVMPFAERLRARIVPIAAGAPTVFSNGRPVLPARQAQ